MIKLVKVSKRYLPNVLKVVEEYRNDTSLFGHRTSTSSLLDAIDSGKVTDWLAKRKDEDKGINLPENYVRSTSYWLMDGKEYVGSFSLRHALTDILMTHGGNIDYIILPSKRQKGYAFSGLGLCLHEAKKLGLDRVLITCDIQNDASYGVIKKALIQYGGEKLPDIVFKKTVNHRVWINTI